MATFTGSDKAIAFLFDMVSNIAEDYDDSATYAVNAYAIYEGVLYKCTSAITTAETFTPAHWTAVLVMNEISAGGGGGGSTTLSGLSDVALSSVANGDVLTYDGTSNKWKNGASGGGHIFSTTEHVVGTWIDGSTVYEKTINIGAMVQDSSWHGTPHGISNLKKIISFDGYVINDTGTEFSAATFFRPQRNTGVAFYATSTTISYMNTYIACSECYVTIQYLKTTT